MSVFVAINNSIVEWVLISIYCFHIPKCQNFSMYIIFFSFNQRFAMSIVFASSCRFFMED
jgi:hypothetical protein